VSVCRLELQEQNYGLCFGWGALFVFPCFIRMYRTTVQIQLLTAAQDKYRLWRLEGLVIREICCTEQNIVEMVLPNGNKL
jgi:hypothetical protein